MGSQYSKGSTGSRKGQQPQTNGGLPPSVLLSAIGASKTLDDKLRNLTSVLASRPGSKSKMGSSKRAGERKGSTSGNLIPKPQGQPMNFQNQRLSKPRPSTGHN